MPCITEKKAPGLNRSPENINKQTNNTIKITPEEDPIKENPPEEHPEDLSFEIEKKETITCPHCGTTNIQLSTRGGLDPQDTVEILDCLNCLRTYEFDQITEEVPF